MMTTQRSYQINKLNPIVLLIGVVLIIGVLFWVAKSILKLLAIAAPVILLAAVIINYRVVLGYGKWLLEAFKRNPLFGALAALFTFIGFPLVSVFLLIRAVTSKGLQNSFSQKKGEFIKYEEVQEDFLDISELKEHKKKIDNDYNDVFN